MPAFMVTSPDGTKYRVNGPEGSTQADAISYVQNNHTQHAPEGSSLWDDVKSVAGRTVRDIAGGLGSVADIPTALINLKTGIDNHNPFLSDEENKANAKPMLGLPSEYIDKGLDALGVPRPRNAQERIFDAGAKAVGPLLLGQPEALLASPKIGLASVGLSGMSGQATKEAGGGPLAQFAASVAGGLAPTGLASLAGAAGNAGFSSLKNLISPASDENIGQILVSQAENPNQSISNLQTGNTQIVPGSFPTTAEVAKDSGLAASQRAFENVNTRALAPQRDANNAVRSQYLADIARSPADLRNAITERSNITSPLYNLAKTDPVDSSFISPVIDMISSAIEEVGAHTDAGKTLLKLKSDITQSSSDGAMQGPLVQTYREARDKASASAMQDGAYSDAVKGIVKPIIHDLGQSMEGQSPNLSAANSKFRELSKPINQMESLQGIQERITNENTLDALGNGRLSLPKLNSALSTEGRNELQKVLTPEQLGRLDNIQADMQRQSIMNAYRPVGSNTQVDTAFGSALKDLADTSLKRIPIYGSKILENRTNALTQGLTKAYSNPQVAAKSMLKALSVLQKESIPATMKAQMLSALTGTGSSALSRLNQGGQ